ncbi:hypothetical protein DPEC_G00177540 [Dallia pectoralis]|uniref:Uncharacterized protein n=1 Tax=Dallia pectoralis TaxID=75939 RepID=A0ACC2GFB0_DALPE|nr:hypothetical protein DPEC_G00177540 [Dallia pectoralis]
MAAAEPLKMARTQPHASGRYGSRRPLQRKRVKNGRRKKLGWACMLKSWAAAGGKRGLTEGLAPRADVCERLDLVRAGDGVGRGRFALEAGVDFGDRLDGCGMSAPLYSVKLCRFCDVQPSSCNGTGTCSSNCPITSTCSLERRNESSYSMETLCHDPRKPLYDVQLDDYKSYLCRFCDVQPSSCNGTGTCSSNCPITSTCSLERRNESSYSMETLCHDPRKPLYDVQLDDYKSYVRHEEEKKHDGANLHLLLR